MARFKCAERWEIQYEGWEHGRRRVWGPSAGKIMKAHKNNLKDEIKRQLDKNDLSLEQLNRICEVVEE